MGKKMDLNFMPSVMSFGRMLRSIICFRISITTTFVSLEPDTCVFEVKEGPFVSHKDGGILL